MKNKSGDSWQLKHQRLRKQSGSSPKQGDGKASNTLSSCTLVLWNRTCEGASAASLDWSAPLSERPMKPESGTSKVLGLLRLLWHKTRHKWCTSDTCVLEGQIPHLERMRQMSRTLVSHPHIDWVLSKLPQSHTHFSTFCWLQIAHDFVPQHPSPICSYMFFPHSRLCNDTVGTSQ